MKTNELITRNIRRFRVERDLSLGELSALAGISKQTLSKVESGVGNPTVETLERIGHGLGVSVVRLMTEWGTPLHVSRAADAPWRAALVGKIRDLDRIYGSGYVRTHVIRVEPEREAGVVGAHGFGTLHQLYVVSGTLEAGPADEVRRLGEGDFLRFPGDSEHTFRAVGGPAVAHLTTTAPQVPQFSDQGDDEARA